MRPLLQIIFCLIFLWSCNGRETSTENTFIKDIPVRDDSLPDLFYELTRQKIDQLKLDDLEKGFDSLQIRIWYNYSLLDYRELVIIKRKDGKWTGNHYIMKVKWNPSDLTVKTNGVENREITPKSGWESFIPDLIDKNIITLPNMEDIEGLEDNWTDGVTYNIEIGTKKFYRFYGYHLPDKFKEYWQAKKMMEILDLIDREFSINSKM